MSPTELAALEALEVDVRGIDIVPGVHQQLATFEGNAEVQLLGVENVAWAEDGEHLWVMFDSHNFMKVLPAEVVRLVKREGGQPHLGWKGVGPKPTPKPRCTTCNQELRP